jgi:hypothetical protein
MPQHHKRRWPLVAVGYAVLFAVVAALAGFIHDAVAPVDGPVVIRLAVAFIVALVVLHLRSWFRGNPRWEPPSEFDAALVSQPIAAKLDASFVRLREQIENGVANRSYFDKVLWPRLQSLVRLRGQDGKPAGRGLGRGPSLRAISELLDQIERRR